MQIIPAVTVEDFRTFEVLGTSVPTPEPREVFARTRRFLAAILLPLDLGRGAEDACALGTRALRFGGHERPDVHSHAVVDVRLPTNRLLRQWLPPNEEIVGRLAGENVRQLRLQVLRGGDPRICAFHTGLLIGALPVDPVAQIGIAAPLGKISPALLGIISPVR